jgi:hypothetical protein
MGFVFQGRHGVFEDEKVVCGEIVEIKHLDLKKGEMSQSGSLIQS